MEVSFDSGNDNESAPKNGRQRLNDFLVFFVFGGRAYLEPTLNKAGIMFQKIERNESTAPRKEAKKPTPLRNGESRRGEKHHSHDDLRSDKAPDSLLSDFA